MSKKYLFIGAHPDDIEIGCAGTVAKLISEGHICEFLVCTNGDQGSQKIPQAELAKIRQQEALEAAQVLNVHSVHFLDLPDGLTKYDLADKIKMISIIRDIRPDVIFVHASSDHHPDHKIIHSLTMNAISCSAGPWFPDATGEPHSTPEVYGYEVWNPINQHQLVVDISAFATKKLEALSKHKSQVSRYPYMDAVEGLGKYRGAIAGGGIAEVFEVLKTKL